MNGGNRGRRGTHILLDIFLACGHRALTELHTKGGGGIVEAPGREIYGAAGVYLPLEVRLVGCGLVMVARGVRRR